jgi:hypothetical protein
LMTIKRQVIMIAYLPAMEKSNKTEGGIDL